MKQKFRKKVNHTKPDLQLSVERETELMKFLIDALPHKSRQNIKSLLSNKQVVVNNNSVSQYNFILHQGDNVKIKWIRNNFDQKLSGFSVVFEDEHLIVIDKQVGVLSVASETERNKTVYNFLKIYVKNIDPSNKIFIVHRLDRDTSGLMIYAKSEKVQKLFQESWKDLVTERIYIAVVEGVFKENSGVISSYLHENKAMVVYSDQNSKDGKEAITNFNVIKRNAKYSMLEVKLDTGRKNQIRVHMQEAGHPIINDKKYGSTVNPIGRLGLHSRTISFIHPITNQQLHYSTPIPVKFMRLF